MGLKELKQQRATVATEMRSLHESIGDAEWSGEQRSKWEAARAKLTQLDDAIKREEELRGLEQEEIEARARDQEQAGQRGQGSPPDQRSQAWDTFLRRGLGDMSPEERKIMAEMRAQGTGSGSAGGYAVPTQFLNKIYEAMKAYGGIAGVCQILNTASGADLEWVTTDGTNEEGELIGENEAAGEQDVEFGMATLGSHKMTSKIIRVSNELMGDAAFSIEAFLARRVGARIGRGEARLIVQGTGAAAGNGKPAQPKGLEAWAGDGGTTAAVGKFDWTDANALIHSIDPAYRAAPQFRLAFNDTTLKLFEEMVDGQKRPLWLPGIDGGAPATILKQRYVIDQGIASHEAGKKFMFAGDFDQFILRRVAYMVIKRLTERYAEFDQTAFLAFHRFDTVLQDSSAIKALKAKAAA